MCGHATLATAYVLFDILGYEKDNIAFDSRSGMLTVARRGEGLALDFPSQPPIACDTPEEVVKSFGREPLECLRSEDLIVVFESENHIASAEPDPEALKKLDLRGVAITAKSSRYDFVARFFAPKYGIPEDPVTGSAYTQLTPYWSAKMGQNRFRVKQLSARGGELTCELADDRVLIYGKAVKYMQGVIDIEVI